jgi:hypothetical protein
LTPASSNALSTRSKGKAEVSFDLFADFTALLPQAICRFQSFRRRKVLPFSPLFSIGCHNPAGQIRIFSAALGK